MHFPCNSMRQILFVIKKNLNVTVFALRTCSCASRGLATPKLVQYFSRFGAVLKCFPQIVSGRQ